MQREVREVCPLLLPSTISKLCYQGYVSSGVREEGVREEGVREGGKKEGGAAIALLCFLQGND